MELKNNNSSKLEDLLLNESFREYVNGTNQESIRLWNEWINAHPEKKEEVERAVLVLRVLMNARKIRVSVDKQESVKLLMAQIDIFQKKNQKSLAGINSVWLRVAAVILVIIGLAALWRLTVNHNFAKSQIAYNEVIVPLGEKAQIVLADGTHVWINSASKLKYPVQFGNASRDVFLEGEAFFDVAKQRGNTFIVNTRDAQVKALGTAFNVKCYPGDEKTQTTVVRGLVKVEPNDKSLAVTFIKPNEMATVIKKSTSQHDNYAVQPIPIIKVDSKVITSWKDQMLVFAGEPFSELAAKMERWFNVRIRIDDRSLMEDRYTGKFVHNETVYQVLEAIKLTTPINYNVKNDSIFITRSNEERKMKN